MSKIETDAPASAENLKPPEEASADSAQDLQLLKEALEKTKAQMEDMRLRHAADHKNLVERTRKEVRDAQDYSVRDFTKDLLSVFDILDESIRSISQDERAPASLAEGLQMTLDMLNKTLTEHSITTIDPQGEVFDPNRHNALSMEETNEVAPKTIVRVIQKGYQIKERLLRPALVIVAKEKS